MAAPGRKWTGQEGQALVEFALIAPILILLIVGVFEFARAWQAFQAVTDAAREVARNAVVVDNICELTNPPGFCPAPGSPLPEVLDSIASARIRLSGLEYADLAMTVNPPDPDTVGRGNAVTVHMDYTYRFVWVGALLGWALGDRTITLQSEFVMRKE